jgi:hypothetical protein
VRQLRLEPILGERNLVHLWGRAGTGKTLLAVALATEASRHGCVEWINTDGKRSFVLPLKASIKAAGGYSSKVNVTLTRGCTEALETIMALPSTVPPGTTMIVVDPITRVIDMGNVDDIMWGRELREDALPALAALASGGVKVIIVSEVRSTEIGVLPVLYDSMKRWRPRSLKAVRGPGRHSTLLLPASEGEEVLAVMKLDDEGLLQLDYPSAQFLQERDHSCLERQSCA